MSSQHQKDALHLSPKEIGRLKQLVQAQRTLQVSLDGQSCSYWLCASRVDAKQLAAAVSRKQWWRRWQETHLLTDLPQSGASRQFSPEVRVQLPALACSLSRAHRLPLLH